MIKLCAFVPSAIMFCIGFMIISYGMHYQSNVGSWERNICFVDQIFIHNDTNTCEWDVFVNGLYFQTSIIEPISYENQFCKLYLEKNIYPCFISPSHTAASWDDPYPPIQNRILALGSISIFVSIFYLCFYYLVHKMMNRRNLATLNQL